MEIAARDFHDFADKVANAGMDTVAVVYFAGDGLQFEGKNYLVPVGADIATASDIPVRALGLSEAMHAVAALHERKLRHPGRCTGEPVCSSQVRRVVWPG